MRMEKSTKERLHPTYSALYWRCISGLPHPSLGDQSYPQKVLEARKKGKEGTW
jgi:hypothetical protein